MIDDPADRPDITLTLDRNGVIRSVDSSEALGDESVSHWTGRSWRETVPPELGSRVSEAVEASTRTGEPSCFRVQHRLPSGKDLPVEYTTVSLGKNAGFVAIGRSLQIVSDLQSRLVDAQRDREQDYWKLREIETRYRAVLDATSDAVALVRATTLRVVEANVAAARLLGLVPGSEFFPDLAPRDRKALDTTLDLTRAQGRAPSIALHLPNGAKWSLRASAISSEADSFYLCQMSQFGDTAESAGDSLPLENILQRFPDAFAVIDREGVVMKANHTFLDFAQIGAESAVIGKNLRRWMTQPGADSSVILGLVRRHGSVRMMRSQIEGDLGSVTQVEVSAVGDRAPGAEFVGLTFRDVGSREMRSDARPAPSAAELGLGMELPKNSLDEVVKASMELIERRCIEEALTECHGNRTSAARYLGLSRQTLHIKLNKYKLDQL
jgi:transcriptional regulator PpsR